MLISLEFLITKILHGSCIASEIEFPKGYRFLAEGSRFVFTQDQTSVICKGRWGSEKCLATTSKFTRADQGKCGCHSHF